MIQPNAMAKRFLLFAVLIGNLLAVVHRAQAIPIVITDPAPNFVQFVEPNPPAKCEHRPPIKEFLLCKSNAYVKLISLSGPDAEFLKSFDAWNAEVSGGRGWTLLAGGPLPLNLPGQPISRFEVSTFRASAARIEGGVNIQIDWTYLGPDKGEFFWTQGLFDNYSFSTPV